MLITLLFSSPLSFVLISVGLLLAITIHEFAHAWVANKLGDPTAELMGRVTLNPLAHLDPVGTIALLLIGFGWGKPVPFDPFNLENPRKDSAMIALAGPVSNIILLIILTPIYRMTGLSVLEPIMYINLVLALFNLIPVYPLDGFKIVGGLLPEDQSEEWQSLQRYGMYFLIFMILPIFNGASLVSYLLTPLLDNILGFLLG